MAEATEETCQGRSLVWVSVQERVDPAAYWLSSERPAWSLAGVWELGWPTVLNSDIKLFHKQLSQLSVQIVWFMLTPDSFLGVWNFDMC